jgi:hypothetical protein
VARCGLGATLDRLAADVRNAYLITFLTGTAASQPHPLSVTVGRSGATVRTARAYIAAPAG